MKNRLWNKNGSWNLKVFFTFSLGFHLFLLFIFTLFIPEFKIVQVPHLPIEVSLLSVIAKERPIVHPKPSLVRKEIRKEEVTPLQEENSIESVQKKDELPKSPPPVLPSPVPAELKVITPTNEHRAPSPENGKRDIRNIIEEKKEEESISQEIRISSQSDSSLSFERENLSIAIPQSKVSHEDLYPSTGFSDGQENSAKLPSTSVDDFPAKPVKKVNPVYPDWAKKKGYQGRVILKVRVFSNGKVGEIKVKESSGHDILDHSAIAALRQWKFIPGREGDKPIWYWVTIPFKFELDENSPWNSLPSRDRDKKR